MMCNNELAVIVHITVQPCKPTGIREFPLHSPGWHRAITSSSLACKKRERKKALS